MKAEGAAMYESAAALKDMMIELGMACDGGKDSLSMAATAGGETVMAPGNLVISAYAGCPDVTKVVTPDLKQAGSYLLHVDLGKVRGCRFALSRACQQGLHGVVQVGNALRLCRGRGARAARRWRRCSRSSATAAPM